MTKSIKLSGRNPQQLRTKLGRFYEAITIRQGSIVSTEIDEPPSECCRATVRYRLLAAGLSRHVQRMA